jgi:hypothetical protein
MKHGECWQSKASPLNWLEKFLKQYSPDCHGKYVHMDQGGELYHNPQVHKLFQDFGYEVHPSGANASNQNGPVEHGHLMVENAVHALLIGANLDIKFWPYAFHHWICIDNSLPSCDQADAPLKIATGQCDDFSSWHTFGCHVWVWPPGCHPTKFHTASKKGIFLGFLPGTTRNIIWYDPKTSHPKIAKHVQFDEGMNDLPLDEVPPNIVHLQCMQGGEPFPAEELESGADNFQFQLVPYNDSFTGKVRVSCYHANFGITVGHNQING